MYVTEISPTNLRGTLGSVCQLQVTIAIFISQVLGLPFFFGNKDLWPFIFGNYFSNINLSLEYFCFKAFW